MDVKDYYDKYREIDWSEESVFIDFEKEESLKKLLNLNSLEEKEQKGYLKSLNNFVEIHEEKSIPVLKDLL